MILRVMVWLALAVGVGTLFLASWIVVPAPTYFLLTFGVGAREVSAWLIVSSMVGLALSVPGIRESAVAKIAAACCVVSLALAISPFARLPGAVARFDKEMGALSAPPRVPLRAKPLVVADLFRGIRIDSERVTRDVAFASPDGAHLTMDVYQPARAGQFPILIQIYGGAWQRGAPGDFANFASWIASAGYVVFAIDYRHAPAARWPAQIDDINTALAWVRDHAAQYDGDTSRVVLMGRSAGAHLAMMAAYTPAPLAVRGVISYYGPADLVDSYRHPPRPDPLKVRSNEEALLGGTLDEMLQRYVEASPVTLADRVRPATLLIYGGADHIVEAKYGARLRDKLAASGTPVAYLEIPWAEHAFDAVFNGPSSQLALYYTERFLAWTTR